MNLIPIDENVSKLTTKRRKARPSVNIKLAQDYRGKEDLPPIERGGPGPNGASKNGSSPEVEYIQIRLDESLVVRDNTGPAAADEKPPRDHVTGRILSKFGRSCLRCTEKDLRCTFNFIGKEMEPQCAACRRAKVPYCVRFQPPKKNKRSIPFDGPPWANPNYFAGTAKDGKVSPLPRCELENILREFYHGESAYVLGNYVTESDACNYALPPFNGVDLPAVDCPANYETMNWQDVLPEWRNRSLQSQQNEGYKEDEREKQKKKLAIARERSRIHANSDAEQADAMSRRNMLIMQMLGKSENVDDEINLLRILRRYQPREQNLADVLGETWTKL